VRKVREKMFKIIKKLFKAPFVQKVGEPSKGSKSEVIIRDAVSQLKMELESFHEECMLKTKKNISGRRIEYAQYLKLKYGHIKNILVSPDTENMIWVGFNFEPGGLTIKVTQNEFEVKQFINYSPYYMSGNNTEKRSRECPMEYINYAQSC
jgi:hypothetical protein